MKKSMFILLTVISCAMFLLSAVMFVMAIRFWEWGRVLAYFVVAIFSAEAAIYSILKLRKLK